MGRSVPPRSGGIRVRSRRSPTIRGIPTAARSMQFHSPMFLRLSPLAFFLVLAPLGCGPSVSGAGTGDGGSGGTGDCTTPKPVSGGWCPPAWQCVDGDWVDMGGACPDPCPASAPSDGASCPYEGLTCDYEGDVFDCGEGGSIHATCTADGWVTAVTYCQPEPECPDALPLDGTSCEGWDFAYYCAYDIEGPACASTATAFCDFTEAGAIWNVQVMEECASCGELPSAEACEAHAACQWLVPGCGEPALDAAGCHPIEPCTAGSCGEGEACATVVIDPCWNSPCDACGAEQNVCQPI